MVVRTENILVDPSSSDVLISRILKEKHLCSFLLHTCGDWCLFSTHFHLWYYAIRAFPGIWIFLSRVFDHRLFPQEFRTASEIPEVKKGHTAPSNPWSNSYLMQIGENILCKTRWRWRGKKWKLRKHTGRCVFKRGRRQALEYELRRKLFQLNRSGKKCGKLWVKEKGMKYWGKLGKVKNPTNL